MPQAAIVIDSRKLPVFKRHLKKSGYIFTGDPYITLSTTLLTIETDNIGKLQQVIETANKEYVMKKAH